MSNVKSRDAIRAELLGKSHAPESRIITLFGQQIELRQPMFGDIMAAKEESDAKARSVRMIIEYAMVPGTNERLFEDTDADVMLKWPFGKDLVDMNKAIAEMTGVDLTKAAEEIKDPLSEQPST